MPVRVRNQECPHEAEGHYAEQLYMGGRRDIEPAGPVPALGKGRGVADAGAPPVVAPADDDGRDAAEQRPEPAEAAFCAHAPEQQGREPEEEDGSKLPRPQPRDEGEEDERTPEEQAVEPQQGCSPSHKRPAPAGRGYRRFGEEVLRGGEFGEVNELFPVVVRREVLLLFGVLEGGEPGGREEIGAQVAVARPIVAKEIVEGEVDDTPVIETHEVGFVMGDGNEGGTEEGARHRVRRELVIHHGDGLCVRRHGGDAAEIHVLRRDIEAAVRKLQPVGDGVALGRHGRQVHIRRSYGHQAFTETDAAQIPHVRLNGFHVGVSVKSSLCINAARLPVPSSAMWETCFLSVGQKTGEIRCGRVVMVHNDSFDVNKTF